MSGRWIAAVAGLLISAVSFGWPAESGAAEPQPKSVVELFTSQGCSSCPPADELLQSYVKNDGVIALTFNVDYWDYLGWKDTLASPAHSARQRAYAQARGDGQVYTPQAVVNGLRHAIGSQKRAIDKAILTTRAALADLRVPLRMWTEGDNLIIEAGAATDAARVKPATIWLALVKQSETVKIQRGENRGRTITYFSVVKDLSPVGRWTGQKVVVKLPKLHLQSGNDGCVALLQQDTAGPILAAVQLKRW